jgi:hypothetical protein
MFKKINKFFRKQVFLTCFLIATGILGVKLFLIPDELEFIEPISIYTALLSSVIFIYGFMIAPAVSEYKESERLRVDLKSIIENILLDIDHFTKLKPEIDPREFRNHIAGILTYIFHRVADDIRGKSINTLLKWTTDFLVEAEKKWITANHIIKVKQELATLRRSIGRLLQIKDTDSLPAVVHNLKNFITLFIISTLLFLNIGNTGADTIFGEIKEGIVIFILSFVYTYLSLIITSLENPFDKRNFSGYIDLSYLKKYAEEITEGKDSL